MMTTPQAKARLLSVLRERSVFHGNFVLSSGAKSNYYIDCRLTTLHPEGAWLTGQVMHSLDPIRGCAGRVKINAIGGLTMGADPIALSIALFSFLSNETPPLQAYVVRKAAKGHGQTKVIEGNFKRGDSVVVIEDVVTHGDSAIHAIQAVVNEGGTVAFVAVLVDRQEGGREKIEAMGYRVVPVFKRDELLEASAGGPG